MITSVPALLVGHVFGLAFWVSGLPVTSMALTRHTQEASAEGRHALAHLERIYLRGLADPAVLLSSDGRDVLAYQYVCSEALESLLDIVGSNPVIGRS